MSEMRKKVEDAYATNDHPEAYLLGVALSLLSRSQRHINSWALMDDVKAFQAAIADHQETFYDSLPS